MNASFWTRLIKSNSKHFMNAFSSNRNFFFEISHILVSFLNFDSENLSNTFHKIIQNIF